LKERYEILKSIANDLNNKIVVDVTNILYLEEFGEKAWGQHSSTTIQIDFLKKEKLGDKIKWTTAWKNTFFPLLNNPPHKEKPASIIVCGDDEKARQTIINIVNTQEGFHGIDGGGIKFSKMVELLGPPWIATLDKLNNGQHFNSYFVYQTQ